MTNIDTITLRRPDDWHLHVRDNAMLSAVIPHTARRFRRAIIMPNLVPPVTDVNSAIAYRTRILLALQTQELNPNERQLAEHFDPKMALYLTRSTSPADVAAAAQCEHVIGYKWYPMGATTNSEFGVHDIQACTEALEAMAEHRVPLLIHGELTDPDIDIFDREARFIDSVLAPLLTRLPKLRVVLEHITTKEGADFVLSQGDHVGGTLTPQHLLLNRSALLVGGIRPHLYCLPILKRERHRIALLEAATSGNPSFFLGTDSAPHAKHTKESACGCAGIFSAHAGIELYAEAFASVNALDKLEAFASLNGPAFYGLDPNPDTITLHRKKWQVPDAYRVDDVELIPFRAGEEIAWTLSSD